ncbi:pre-peptidase C-terminal domain-containing protein [Lysobacter sp. CA196]|uniref:pre-peptidase C-terminal domain-containing protein n=1 Tax=Lysobacter sp. CA196 TaxID=3455606 RepID=UPI003F8D161F
MSLDVHTLLRPVFTVGALTVSAFACAGEPLFVGEINPSSADLRAVDAVALPDSTSRRIMRVNSAAVSETVSEIEADIDGRRVTLVRESARNTDGGGLVWIGHVRETSRPRKMTGREVVHDSLNSVILVRRGNGVTGTVSIDGRSFSISPLSNGEHAVAAMSGSMAERDEVLISQEAPPRPMVKNLANPQSSGFVGPGPAALEVGGDATIRVMVAISKDAKDRIAASGGNIRSHLDLGIASANLAYQNSKVGITLELTNVLELDYSSRAGDPYLDLRRAVAPGDGYMDVIHGERNANAADFVLLVTDSKTYADPTRGIAGLAKLYAGESEAIAYVSSWHLIGYTIAHEFGHLMGAHHDSLDNPGGNRHFRYGQGYCTSDAKYFTVMGTGLNCGTRIGYFSSPELTYGGQILGSADLNDNRRVLIENKHRVAAFRGAPIPANSPPAADFSVSSNGLTATLTDRSVDRDGSIASRSWNFGDGGTATEINPTRTYAKAGTYNVALTVTDDKGAQHTVIKSVAVIAPVSPTGTLSNGVPVDNISGATDSNRYWTLVVPPGASKLRFATSGYSGDADLYVKYGSAPTTSSYDCRANLGSGAETCNIPTAQAGTYHVMVNGWSAFSGMRLVGSYDEGGADALVNGVAKTDISGAARSYRFWTMQVPSGASELQFATSGYSGDADLYVKYGSAPTPTNYDCRANLGSTSETCRIAEARAGAYHVMVNGWSAYSGMRLLGSYRASTGSGDTGTGVGVLSNGVSVSNISGSTGSYKYWALTVPFGASDLEFIASGYRGDADLYIKYGSSPTTTNYDCRANLGSAMEVCRIANVQAGTYYVMVNGWSAFSGMNLVGTYRSR